MVNINEYNDIFIKIESEIFIKLDKHIEKIKGENKKVIVGIDDYIMEIYGEDIKSKLGSIFEEVSIIEIANNDINNSFNIAKICIETNTNLIIGIGGGRVLDVCKYAAHINKKYFISIPTAIAHDGVASPIAVLGCGNEVKSLGSSLPNAILVDLDIIKKSPIELRKAGVGDTLSNYVAIRDWKLANKRKKEEINSFSVLLSELAVKSILNHKNKDLDDLEFIKILVESCILSGLAMNIAGNSRPCSGSEHLISHAMDKLNKKNLHGIQVGVASIISLYLHGEDIQEIKSFLEVFELPRTIEELGFNIGEFKEIIRMAKFTRENRYTILDEIDMSDEQLNKIYVECFS